jgi:hypothetical protein
MFATAAESLGWLKASDQEKVESDPIRLDRIDQIIGFEPRSEWRSSNDSYIESHRRFTPSEELRLLESIKTKLLDTGIFYNDQECTDSLSRKPKRRLWQKG